MIIIKQAKKEYFFVDNIGSGGLLPMTIEEWEDEVINHISCFKIDRYFCGDHYTKRFLIDDQCLYLERTYKL